MSAREHAMRPATGRLLRQVATRQRLAALGSRFHLFLLALAGVYCVLFLASRLLGLIPDWFDPLTLLVLPAGALVLGVVFHRRPTPTEAAHLIDSRADARDLFLTAALLDDAPGDYKPIVLEQAEQKAAAIRPSRVAPYRWQAKARNVVLALAVLLLGVRFLPQLDPFGREKEREKAAERRHELADNRKATALRAALLKKSDLDAKTSLEAQRGIEELKKAFNRMKPTDKKGNFQRLAEIQKPLGALWRKRSEQRLRDAFARSQDTQRLGAGKGEKTERWKRRLKRGDASGLKKEIEDLKEKALQLSNLTNPAEKQKLRQKLKQRLKELSDFLANNASSKSVEQSLKRALEQLTMAERRELSTEAMKALKESLELTELELDKLAQAIRDLQSLEEALKAAQLAKQLNQLHGLDGKACQGCKDIGDYAEFYRKLMEDAEEVRVGPGMGGPGIGRGGEAPEDPQLDSDFKTERSRSAFKAGKILLQWKTTQLSERGTARENYQQHIEAVKHGMSEAILQEQVPPGYHDAIKKYFDSLGEKRERP
jgi:hypothetical protein